MRKTGKSSALAVNKDVTVFTQRKVKEQGNKEQFLAWLHCRDRHSWAQRKLSPLNILLMINGPLLS